MLDDRFYSRRLEAQLHPLTLAQGLGAPIRHDCECIVGEAHVGAAGSLRQLHHPVVVRAVSLPLRTAEAARHQRFMPLASSLSGRQPCQLLAPLNSLQSLGHTLASYIQ